MMRAMTEGAQSRIELDGRSLTFAELGRIADGEVTLAISDEGWRRVEAARATVDQLLNGSEVAYGINTGFGRFCRVRISPEEVRELQVNLVRSHGTGVGEPLGDRVVRLSLALRANTLARGNSGVRRATLQLLLDVYNQGVLPWIPQQGSVGACGDLAPLAHLAQVLIGEGRARTPKSQDWIDGGSALKSVALAPVELEAKEGLALINGVQVSAALLADALLIADELLYAADIAGALSLEASLGSASPFDVRIHDVRPHPGQAQVAAHIRSLLDGSAVLGSHVSCDRVQDAYSFRCMPQVHGAVQDAVEHVRTTLMREVNSSTDNPLVFAEEGEVLSGGNFHGAPIAYVADLLAIVMTDLASISERRIERLVNPDLSGLPAFLSPREGLQSGFMMAQVTAAALTSENKVLAHPASVDSIPTSANTEDHVSMSTHAARKALTITENVEKVIGIELMIALQAFEHRRPLKSGPALEAKIAVLRSHLQPLDKDRNLSQDIASASQLIREGQLRTE